jgi:hypothetical protein
LSELVAYQDLLVEVAKGLYRRSHPTRRRVPAGFVRRLQLTLGDVRDGCVTAVLERPAAEEALIEAQDDLLAQAQRAIERVVGAASAGEELPEDFPRSALLSFGRFGRTFQEGDCIQLRAPGAASGVAYTRRVRTRLMLPAPPDRFLAETVIVGRVQELDVAAPTAVLLLDSGRTVECPVEEEHFGVLHAALTLHDGPRVRVAGIALLDADQHVLQMESVTSVERVSQIGERLEEIGSLAEGWLGDGSEAPPPSWRAIEAARSLAHRLEAQGLRPRIYPSTEGGVSLEWTSGRYLTSVEVDNELGVHVLEAEAAPGGHVRDVELPTMDEQQVLAFLKRRTGWGSDDGD